jgi:hypothetical protein
MTDHNYREIAMHIIPWFKNELLRCLPRRYRRNGIELIETAIHNIHGGVYEIAVTPQEWFAAREIHSLQEMIDQGYYILTKNPVPEECYEIASVLNDAISKVYTEDWFYDLDPNEGHWFGEWIELKKTEFKRTFWRILKDEQRQNQEFRSFASYA